MLNQKQILAKQSLGTVEEIPAAVMDHIYFKVDQMIGTSNLWDEDRKDLIQELTIAVWRRMQKAWQGYQKSIGTNLLNKVVDDKVNDIYRFRSSRGLNQPFVSIDESQENEEGDDELPMQFESDDLERMEQRRRCEDIRVVVASLDPKLRKMCELYMSNMSFEQMASVLGVEAVTLRTRWLPKVKQAFVKAGF